MVMVPQNILLNSWRKTVHLVDRRVHRLVCADLIYFIVFTFEFLWFIQRGPNLSRSLLFVMMVEWEGEVYVVAVERGRQVHVVMVKR